MTFTIENLIKDAERLGGGEYTPGVELVLDEDGDAYLRSTDTHSSNNGTTFDRVHRRTLVWATRLSQGSCAAPSRALADIAIVKLAPLVARVAAGHKIEWDGNNNVGRLATADAIAAADEIDSLVGDEWGGEFGILEPILTDRTCVDGTDWIGTLPYGAGRDDFASQFSMTPEEALAKNEDELEAEFENIANSEGIVLMNASEAVTWVREKAEEIIADDDQ